MNSRGPQSCRGAGAWRGWTPGFGVERGSSARMDSHALSQCPLLIQAGVRALGKLGVVMTQEGGGGRSKARTFGRVHVQGGGRGKAAKLKTGKKQPEKQEMALRRAHLWGGVNSRGWSQRWCEGRWGRGLGTPGVLFTHPMSRDEGLTWNEEVVNTS